jgi:hypothetical protein
MQAYHQSFNPQAYITNTNGAAAAAAAAAYYQHHNPASYVLPGQYSITDGFSYSAAAAAAGASPASSAAVAAALVNTPQAYATSQVGDVSLFHGQFLLEIKTIYGSCWGGDGVRVIENIIYRKHQFVA